MPTYEILSSYTDQGIRSIKDAPKRLQTRRTSVEKGGGKIIASYSLMGQYDRMMIMECPNDESAAAIALSLGMTGNTRTTTLKAFTDEEFVKIVSKL